MLVAEKITKSYGELRVLKGVDLQVADSEIVCIVGSSGAGKSTLLHILGTLDQADSGTMFIGGQRVDNLKSKTMARFRNQHLGFVFQFHHLLPEFSALENVSIPGWIAGRKKKDVEQRAEELLVLLGLKDRLQNKPGALSGGEQQRVAVARALINQPEIVFADEPTGNLDSYNTHVVFDILKELTHTYKQTLIAVTHDEEFARNSDRIIEAPVSFPLSIKGTAAPSAFLI